MPNLALEVLVSPRTMKLVILETPVSAVQLDLSILIDPCGGFQSELPIYQSERRLGVLQHGFWNVGSDTK